MQAPSSSKIPDAQRKADGSKNHITHTISHCYAGKVLYQCGNCLPVRSSDASQGRAGLSKDSSLRPALLTLLCTASMTFALPYFEGEGLLWWHGPGMEARRNKVEANSVPPSHVSSFLSFLSPLLQDNEFVFLLKCSEACINPFLYQRVSISSGA